MDVRPQPGLPGEFLFHGSAAPKKVFPPRVVKPIAGIPSRGELLNHHPGKIHPICKLSCEAPRIIEIDMLLPSVQQSPVRKSGECFKLKNFYHENSNVQIVPNTYKYSNHNPNNFSRSTKLVSHND